MHCRIAMATLLLALAGSAGASAQQDRWTRQVADRLQRALGAFDTSGTRTMLRRAGALNGEETTSFDVTLTAGVTYAIVGVCDDDCRRLHLVLATPTNDELAVERRREAFPIIRFTPRATMPYRVRVRMDACGWNPCRWAVGIVPETAPPAVGRRR
ncbi:MAG: hypothetical protein ACREMN_04320, partial [Gemmatimonadales bacterium]